MINAATSSFETTTGFTIASVVTWMGDNLAKVFIGTGLGTLYSLRYWILAFIVISICVYIAFRAFHFFRH